MTPLEFDRIAAEHNIFFYYCGYLSQSIIEASADAIRLRLESEAVAFKVQRKVLGAFIEMAQNIVHYSAETLTDPQATTDEVRFGMISIAKTDEGIRLTCANPIDGETAERMRPKLDMLSQMSLEEIRAAYRQALRSDERDENSKGGGIGLLTIARESSSPIEYALIDSAESPNMKIFQLSVMV